MANGLTDSEQLSELAVSVAEIGLDLSLAEVEFTNNSAEEL